MEKTQYNYMDLADERFCTPGKIDLILGAEVFAHMMQNDVLKVENGVFQKTTLDYIFIGKGKLSPPKTFYNRKM